MRTKAALHDARRSGRGHKGPAERADLRGCRRVGVAAEQLCAAELREAAAAERGPRRRRCADRASRRPITPKVGKDRSIRRSPDVAASTSVLQSIRTSATRTSRLADRQGSGSEGRSMFVVSDTRLCDYELHCTIYHAGLSVMCFVRESSDMARPECRHPPGTHPRPDGPAPRRRGRQDRRNHDGQPASQDALDERHGGGGAGRRCGQELRDRSR